MQLKKQLATLQEREDQRRRAEEEALQRQLRAAQDEADAIKRAEDEERRKRREQEEALQAQLRAAKEEADELKKQLTQSTDARTRAKQLQEAEAQELRRQLEEERKNKEKDAADLRAQFEASQKRNMAALAAAEDALKSETEQRAALARQMQVVQGMLHTAVRERDMLKQVRTFFFLCLPPFILFSFNFVFPLRSASQSSRLKARPHRPRRSVCGPHCRQPRLASPSWRRCSRR